jgi:hypothetical protein
MIKAPLGAFGLEVMPRSHLFGLYC